jgi:ribonuclease III
MIKPPPPRVPPPGTLNEEQEDALPPGQMVDLTKKMLEKTLGFQVVNFPGNYFECFTHKSVSVYYKRSSYERLEYLGDAVINMITAKYLYDCFPDQNEGFLTKMRTRLCRSDTLAHLARKLQLDRFIFMTGKGLYRRWNTNKRILEDVFESLVGAIYLDQGMVAAKTFFLGLVMRHIDMNDMLKDRNYKDILMRYQHARSQPLPEYESRSVPRRCCTDVGNNNNNNASMTCKVFEVRVVIDGFIGVGMHPTKKGAEQSAAKSVLTLLKVPLDD